MVGPYGSPREEHKQEPPVRCKLCGSEFEGRSDKQYCSKKCGDQAKNLRIRGVTDWERVPELLAEIEVCQICGGPPRPPQERLSIDHDHDTGLIRGLLCRVCNLNYEWYLLNQKKISTYSKSHSLAEWPSAS